MAVQALLGGFHGLLNRERPSLVAEGVFEMHDDGRLLGAPVEFGEVGRRHGLAFAHAHAGGGEVADHGVLVPSVFTKASDGRVVVVTLFFAVGPDLFTR